MSSERQWSEEEKNILLRNAFRDLAGRGITSDWAKSEAPYTQLKTECQSLMLNENFVKSIEDYVRARSILRRSLEMFFTYIAMSARADWKNVSPSIRTITARGWYLGRWLPTFLIIDGPIGRFLNNRESPLCQGIPEDMRALHPAREFIRNKEFYALRNGFAHWGFDWEVIAGESYVVTYNWETDLPT